MSDEYQIEIPPSFAAVFADARGRLAVPLAEVRARYDVCEDLAQLLVEQANLLYHTQAPSEEEVLRRIHAGLAAPGSVVSPGEALWIAQRLAELLNWRCPLLAAPPAG